MCTTWKSDEKSPTPGTRSDPPSSAFAFPRARKESPTSPSQTRKAPSRSDQAKGVSAFESEAGFATIRRSGSGLGIKISEGQPRQPARKSRPRNTLLD